MQDSRSVRVKVYVTQSRLSFEMRFESVHVFFPLLANVNNRAVRFDVPVYFDCYHFRDPHLRNKVKETNHQVLSLCLAEQCSHFLTSHATTTLILRVDAG